MIFLLFFALKKHFSFIGKAQFRRAALSCDSSYSVYFFLPKLNNSEEEKTLYTWGLIITCELDNHISIVASWAVKKYKCHQTRELHNKMATIGQCGFLAIGRSYKCGQNHGLWKYLDTYTFPFVFSLCILKLSLGKLSHFKHLLKICT